MNSETRSYVDIYAILDQVGFAGSAPAGARGCIYRAIDRLRREAAPSEHIAVAEQISVALHRLDWAVQQQDSALEAAAREQLQRLGAQWHQTPIPLCLN